MTGVRRPNQKTATRQSAGKVDNIPAKKRVGRSRAGSSTIDYVLILAVILPLVTFMFTIVPRMIQLIYEMTIVVIGTPLM